MVIPFCFSYLRDLQEKKDLLACAWAPRSLTLVTGRGEEKKNMTSVKNLLISKNGFFLKRMEEIKIVCRRGKAEKGVCVR